MINKIIAWIAGGIATTLMIVILLIAYGAISEGLRQVDPNNPVLGQTIDNTDQAVNEAISWHSVIGTIEWAIFIIGLIVGIVFTIIKLIDKYYSSQSNFL